MTDDDEDPESFDDSGSKMSFLEHLDELRKRLIYIVYSLIAGCVIAFIFISEDLRLHHAADAGECCRPGGHLQFTSGAEPFML